MRCNIIPPSFLTDQHLIAERRELRMIPPLFQKRYTKLGKLLVTAGIPDRFTLGSGHMLFWMDKGEYLHTRFGHLTNEMLKRGFNPDLSLEFHLSDEHREKSVPWQPTQKDVTIIVKRLADKILMKPLWYKYYSKPLQAGFVENLLNLYTEK